MWLLTHVMNTLGSRTHALTLAAPTWLYFSRIIEPILVSEKEDRQQSLVVRTVQRVYKHMTWSQWLPKLAQPEALNCEQCATDVTMLTTFHRIKEADSPGNRRKKNPITDSNGQDGGRKVRKKAELRKNGPHFSSPDEPRNQLTEWWAILSSRSIALTAACKPWL